MKNIIILIISFFAINSFAGENKVYCTYNFENKEVIVETNKKEYKKVKKINGLTYTTYIKDTSNPSEFDDYVNVDDGKYNITYHLSCQKI